MSNVLHSSSSAPPLDELEFLSGAVLTLSEEFCSEDEILHFVAEQLSKIAPESLVGTTHYDLRTDTVVVRSFVGPAEMLRTLREALGTEVVGLSFPVNDEARRRLGEGKLLSLTGVREASHCTWPVEFAKHIEARLGIRAVHGQSFARRGDVLGTAVILSRRPRLEHSQLIEAFVRQAAVTIKRVRLEQRLWESERRFRTLAENSRDVIFRLRLKPKREFEYVSPAAKVVIGCSPEELYANPDLGADSLYPKDWTSSSSPHALPPERIMVSSAHHGGRVTWTEQTLTPISDEHGEVVALEGVVRDCTARKEAEEALVEGNRRKTEFIALLSHELRNPLSPIRSGLYILDRADPQSNAAKRARAAIERQVDHLTRIVDDLLDVTRIERGRIRLQRAPLELNELVSSTSEDHSSLFTAGNVELEVNVSPEPIWIDGDRTRIAQLVGNLLLNAKKFTPAGGRTTISVSALPGVGQAVLTVHDTGVGIAPELLPHLFEPFTQADTTIDRGKGGLGLGLVLVKGLAELHGGSATVTSEGRGKGASFSIRLPTIPGPRSLQPETLPRSSGAALNVLVIEDNVDAAEMLRDALQLGDVAVDVAYDGREGIAKARALRPDVILCDIGLPGLDGYAVAHAIRDIPELRGVGLVALTGYASPEDVARARRAGFDRHLAKPPTIDVLQHVVAELGQRAKQ